MNYLEYKTLLNNLMAVGNTTGSDQSEAMIHYAELNIQRMKRLDKTTVLSKDWSSFLAKINTKLKWVVLTEGWCGDAAQIVPVINKIAEESNGKIELELLLRDENLTLMDRYLTNGGRAIPKLICYNENNEELWNWGPRPKGAQEFINQLKANGADLTKIKTDLHLWYTKNKTVDTQNEIMSMFSSTQN